MFYCSIIFNRFNRNQLRLKQLIPVEHDLIDNIFFNSLEYATYSGNIIFLLTDHLPNVLSIDSIHPLPLNKEIYKRDFSKLNEEALISDFQQIDWPNMFHGMDDINDNYTVLLYN